MVSYSPQRDRSYNEVISMHHQFSVSSSLSKFLLLISAFATVLALYYSFEQAFCTDEEKRSHATKLGLEKPSGGQTGENQELLEEQNIPMEDLTCDLTSVDLQEVTADTGQGLAVDVMYTCRVPVVCIERDEEDFGEELRRSRVTGEGYLTSVQSGVCSDSQNLLTDPARNECVSVQPAGANIQRTAIDLLAYAPPHESIESSDFPHCSASPKKVSPEIQAAASQLARLDEVPVNRPITSHDTDVQPLIQTSYTEQSTLLVNSIEGSSIQPTKLPETLHSNLDVESGNEIIAPSMFTSDSTDSAPPRHTLSSEKCVDLQDFPLVHLADGIKELANTKELLNERAIVLDKSQGYPLEWDVLTSSAQDDWTTPTFDAFQPVSTDTATNEGDEIISDVQGADVRCQTPPFLSH